VVCATTSDEALVGSVAGGVSAVLDVWPRAAVEIATSMTDNVEQKCFIK
jgi:hypothetical protein